MPGSFDPASFGNGFDIGADANSAIKWTTIENAIWAWIVAGSGLAGDHVTWSQQTAPRPSGEFISMRLTMLEHKGRDWLDRTNNYVTVGTLTITSVSVPLGTVSITAHGLVTGQGPLVFGGAPPVPAALATSYWPIVVDANTIKIAATYLNAVAPSPVPIVFTTTGTTPTLTGTSTTTIPGLEIVQKLRGPRRALLTLQCFAGTPTGGAATGFTSPAAVLHDAIASYALESRATALAAAGIGIGSVEPIRSIDGVVNTTHFEPRAIGTVYLHFASELTETSTYIQVVNATDLIPGPSITVTLP